MPDPADIARALSEAKKIALLKHASAEQARASFGDMHAEFSLLLDGLVEINSKGCLIPTEAGLAVRDYLLHRPTASDASTDRNQATVVRCGKEIE